MNYIEERTLKCAEYIDINKATIRQTARVFNLGKSTVHANIHKFLPYLDLKLYTRVEKILISNFENKHLRGGEATRLKYIKKQGK